jgi:hypothetical protein
LTEREREREKRQKPLTMWTPKKFCKNRRLEEVSGGGEHKGHHLKANTPKLSSQRIRARSRHKIHKARRISLLLCCGGSGGSGCPATNRPSLLSVPPRIRSLSALRPIYLPSGVVHLSRRILLNKYLSLLHCRHAHVRSGFSLIEKRLFYLAPWQRENMMSCCALWNFFILVQGE